MAYTFTFEGISRRFSVHLPWQWVQLLLDEPSLLGRLPLVVCLHGSGIVGVMPSLQAAYDQMRMHEIPETAGSDLAKLCIVIYVEGVGFEGGGRASWNSGTLDLWSITAGTKDTEFLKEVVNRVTAWLQAFFQAQTGQTALVVDPARRYLVGFCNGGCLAYRCVAEGSFWASAVIVNGSIGGRAQLAGGTSPIVRWTPLATASKKPILHVHATGNQEFRPGLIALPALQIESASDAARLAAQKVRLDVVTQATRQDYNVVTAMADWITHNHGVGYFNPSSVPYLGGTLHSWAGSGPWVQALLYDGTHQWPSAPIGEPALLWSYFRQGRLP